MSKLAYVIRKLLRLSPQSSAPSSLEKGELYVDNTTGAPMYHNGSSESQVLTAAHSATLTNKTFDADGTGNSISNIENADIKTGAAIDHAKLANMTAGYILQGNASNVPTATQVTGDVTISNSGVTAIASGVIVNDDVNASAAIDRSKLANGTADHVVINSGAGAFSSEATLAKSRGGAGADMSSVTFPSSGTIVTRDASETLTNKTLTSPTITTGLADDGLDFNEEASLSSPSAGRRRLGLKSDGKLYLRDSSGNESEIGSGGTSGINYIDNPDFETAATGYSAYADAAATSPVDGTGGSPTVSITRSTSSPLRGIASGLIAKDAANRQGEGVSYDFTIDSVDKAQVLRISFDYAVSSGTFDYGDGTVSDPSDLRVFIYDVTNSLLIEPSNTLLNGSGRFISEFQSTADSTSYRLIFHVATTSASAWDLKIDNVNVGPREVARGPIITDWVTFTPTDTTIAAIPLTSSLFQYKRVGDSIDLRIVLTVSGAITGTDLDEDEFLPPGLTLDTNKLTASTANVFGVARMSDSSAASSANDFTGTAILLGTTRQLRILADRGDSVDSTDPFTWASGDFMEIALFNVPIAGWSSNVVTSSDSGTRVVAFTAADDAPTSSAFNGTANLIFATTSDIFKDSHNAYNASTGIWTAPEAGWYSISGQTAVTGTEASNQYLSLGVYKGGSLQNAGTTRLSTTALTSTFASVTSLLYLVAGDQISLRINSDITGAAIETSTPRHTFNIHKVQSPQSIGMADTVAARYLTNAGASISSSATPSIVDFEDKDFDTHNSVTTGASWKFTAPMSGIYSIQSNLSLSRTADIDDGEEMRIHIYKNGTAVYRVTYEPDASTASVNAQSTLVAASLIKMNAGDYIDVRISQMSGVSLTLNAIDYDNTISIHRIG